MECAERGEQGMEALDGRHSEESHPEVQLRASPRFRLLQGWRGGRRDPRRHDDRLLHAQLHCFFRYDVR